MLIHTCYFDQLRSRAGIDSPELHPSSVSFARKNLDTNTHFDDWLKNKIQFFLHRPGINHGAGHGYLSGWTQSWTLSCTCAFSFGCLLTIQTNTCTPLHQCCLICTRRERVFLFHTYHFFALCLLAEQSNFYGWRPQSHCKPKPKPYIGHGKIERLCWYKDYL